MTTSTRCCHPPRSTRPIRAAGAAQAAALGCLTLASSAFGGDDLLLEQKIDGYAQVESLVNPLGIRYEAADDFTVNGSIERVWIYGGNCCLGSCSFPTDIVEVTIRFYTVADGGQPGELLAEYVLDGDDPDFV